MGRKKITEAEMVERVNIIIDCLKAAPRWHSSYELSEKTGMTPGQLASAIKYNRRYFMNCPEKCKDHYILSGRFGYKMPETDEDYVAMYKSLFSWGKSVLITISPIGKYLSGKGFDMKSIREEAMANNDGTHSENDEIGGADSWHAEM